MRTWPALLCILFAVPLIARAVDSPFDVGSRAQLFVDLVLVRSTERVRFTFHPATKHPGNPIERGAMIYDAEEKVFKSWGHSPLATSTDGLTWRTTDHKPWTQFGYVRVIKDFKDPDPARRYKIIAWGPNANDAATNTGYNPPIRHGYNTYISPDGIRLFPVSQKPIWPGGDVITGYYDDQRKFYVAFPKTMKEVRGFYRRCFSVMTSRDFEHWTEPKLAFVPDHLDDEGSMARLDAARPILDMPTEPKLVRTEFYGIGGPYQAESCVVVFPWMITVNNKARYGNQDGCGDVQIAVSRDLEHWERPFRTSAIPLGKIGEWDCGFIHGVSQVFRVSDELWVYYLAQNYPHAHPVDRREAPSEIRALKGTKYVRGHGLAKWKLDRFVSVDAPAEGGTLTTVPIVFTGQRLELNAATKPNGSITVEILDASGQPIPGFAKSEAFQGDALQHEVAFRPNASVSSLAGRPILLRFHMKNAQLYGFAFRSGLRKPSSPSP